MEKSCVKCSSNFIVDEDDKSFYEKMKVPVPNLCPDCRFKIRSLFRNEMNLYSGRKCDMCSKSIVTMYNPKSPYIVYCYDCYYGDAWDPKDYAIDYNPNIPFFDQLKELLLKVPKAQGYRTTGIGPSVNSEYVNCSGGLKNCYFVFNTGLSEECMYDRGLKDSTETVDSYYGTKLDQCYEIVNGQQCSQASYAKNVVGCVDSHLLLNCSGLTDCFGCVNLRNKSYCWYNEQLTKEDYADRFKSVSGSYKAMLAEHIKFDKFSLDFPVRANSNIKNVSSSGDYLVETKNVRDSFEVSKAEDSRYIFSSKDLKDSYGTIGYGYRSELLLECVAVGVSSRIIGSYGIDEGTNLEYCFSCHPNNKELFGCDSIRNSNYFILNKEYTKEEYEKVREHLVKELTDGGVYGLMMPPELAPFAYNEGSAHDNFPLTKEEVLALGFRWEDDIQMTKGKETLLSENIPDHIKDVQDLIIAEVLKCKSCERNYKITGQELHFYRKMILPIPRKCFYCRHQDRIVKRGPYKFWERNCAHCNKLISTNYSPERPEIIYCEQCYQQEVI